MFIIVCCCVVVSAVFGENCEFVCDSSVFDSVFMNVFDIDECIPLQLSAEEQ